MKKRVLIVEDEPLIALDVETTLQAAGSNVIGIAGDINAAMKLIESECIDFVVLDAELRGRSAEPVAKLLRQREIPFIVVTGYGSNQLEWIGDAPHIQKPFDSQKIAHFDFVK